MRNRYERHGEIHIVDTKVVPFSTITTECSALRDKLNGAVYPDGFYRVRIVTSLRCDGAPRTKSFKGESAWNNAYRYAEDARSFFNRKAV
jgi:hypothetical protein